MYILEIEGEKEIEVMEEWRGGIEGRKRIGRKN